MYDSDEIRDAVRRDMLQVGRVYGAMDGTTDIERAALQEARDAMQAEAWAAWEAAVQAFAKALREAAESIARTLMEGLAQAIQPALEAIKDWPSNSNEAAKPAPPWARRPRQPDIYPVRPIDAVAAGRHPAMIMRTQIRGGRR